MPLTKVTSGVRTLGTGEVTSANLAAGAVDTSGLEDDIALLGFRVASNGSLAKYDLVDQTVDDFQDASGIDASASTGENFNSTNNYYSGSANNIPTGGTETAHGLYSVNTFLASGDLVVPASGNLDFLVVAGGGGGGSEYNGSTNDRASGGGGAGGVRVMAATAVTAQTYAIVVGAGGAAASSNAPGASGSTSSAAGISASGGGGGGSTGNTHQGTDGGSGGGNAGGGGATGRAGNTGGYSPVEGYASGGTKNDGDGGGGGGGAGGVGGDSNASSNGNGGLGGIGISNDWRTGSGVFYGGGGGGGSEDTNVGGTGGSSIGGAGGAGQNASGSRNGADAVANTGSGGGGAGEQVGGAGSQLGGDGSAGIVVVRALTSAWQTYSNMTLVSNATTSEATPTKGDMVCTITNGAGTTTLNTDIKAYVSRDNGTTYTQGTLASQGTSGGHDILTFHDLDISSQPSGTSMRYKITTHNQSVSKTTRIQAVSLGWS